MNQPSQHCSGVGLYISQAQCPLSLCQLLCQWAQSHQQVAVVTSAVMGSVLPWMPIWELLMGNWKRIETWVGLRKTIHDICRVWLGGVWHTGKNTDSGVRRPEFKPWLLVTNPVWVGQVFSSLWTSILLIYDKGMVISALIMLKCCFEHQMRS